MYEDLNQLNDRTMEDQYNLDDSSTDTVLSVNNFTVLFEKANYNVVTEFGSFDIKEGDFFLLKGRNGSGKSTFLKYITNNFVEGIYSKVKDGEIVYISKGGKKICPHNTSSDKVAFLRRQVVEVSQFDDNQSTMSAYDVLMEKASSAINYSKSLSKEEQKEIDRQLEKLVNNIYKGIDLPNGDNFSLGNVLGSNGIKEFRRKKISNYSGGQQKMVNVIAGLLKAIVMESNLLLLDEPVNNLDGKNKYYMDLLIEYVRNKNPKMAIVMISHCHIFNGINKVVDVDNGPENNTFIARLIDRETANEFDKLKFIPHMDCIEDCGMRKR